MIWNKSLIYNHHQEPVLKWAHSTAAQCRSPHNSRWFRQLWLHPVWGSTTLQCTCELYNYNLDSTLAQKCSETALHQVLGHTGVSSMSFAPNPMRLNNSVHLGCWRVWCLMVVGRKEGWVGGGIIGLCLVAPNLCVAREEQLVGRWQNSTLS